MPHHNQTTFAATIAPPLFCPIAPNYLKNCEIILLPSLAMPVVCIEKRFIMLLPALRSTNTKFRPHKSRIKKKSIREAYSP